MLRKFISLSLALGLLGACTVSPEKFKVGTKNGKDIYQFDVRNQNELNHYSKMFCPQGYNVVDYKYDGTIASVISPVNTAWYKATIACPAR